MTQLEMEISTARDKTDALKTDVDDGIEAYKKRLRAMYIAGSTSYTEVLLGSGDFFDVLLRSELLKRVTEYDANALDELVEKKEEYESKVADLESKQAEYDAQSTDLEAEKEKLTELYESSSQTKALLKQQKEALEKEQETYDSEISAYEGTLGTLLKGTYSSSAD
jgi:peptidoglycan hydrolase CwlO-like protein